MAEDMEDVRRDRSRVNVEDAEAVLYWTRRFFVTEQRLRETVAEVGDNAAAVAEAFGKPFPPD